MKPRKSKSIDDMNLDELMAHNAELSAKLNRLLAERAKKEAEQRPNIDAMSDEERAAYQQHLMHSIAGKLEPAPSTPEPSLTVEESPQYDLPTKRMEQAIARFDDLSDSDQVDALAGLWGEDGQP